MPFETTGLGQAIVEPGRSRRLEVVAGRLARLCRSVIRDDSRAALSIDDVWLHADVLGVWVPQAEALDHLEANGQPVSADALVQRDGRRILEWLDSGNDPSSLQPLLCRLSVRRSLLAVISGGLLGVVALALFASSAGPLASLAGTAIVAVMLTAILMGVVAALWFTVHARRLYRWRPYLVAAWRAYQREARPANRTAATLPALPPLRSVPPDCEALKQPILHLGPAAGNMAVATSRCIASNWPESPTSFMRAMKDSTPLIRSSPITIA